MADRLLSAAGCALALVLAGCDPSPADPSQPDPSPLTAGEYLDAVCGDPLSAPVLDPPAGWEDWHALRVEAAALVVGAAEHFGRDPAELEAAPDLGERLADWVGRAALVDLVLRYGDAERDLPPGGYALVSERGCR